MLRLSTIFLVCALALHPLYVYGDDEKQSCRPHQLWDRCGTACPLNCQNFRNPPEVCTKNCVSGCFCKEPYVFLRGTSGLCILPRQCPPYKE
ncbi:venom peptide SjAPI-2-like [Xenopus laevis]|uniref:Venom peptide SjAPI-2-like n=1 Tax=Xenopus laevis TaxID=8355 RepID=A0A8J1L9N5_XENLA|nr:venom peptide SjAPI-2-like [Xenopus laevis]XP_041425695.1 venom peptide SjAPI-2-like [Xenopus laevis]